MINKLKFLLFTALLLPIYTLAWHGNGHMTAGAIAYYYMKRHNPAALQKVLATLKLHPWYRANQWRSKLTGLTQEQKNVALFMLASTFPDDARDVPGLGGDTLALWHYIDYPFVPAGQNVHGHPPGSPNAKEKITGFMTSLPMQAPSGNRAIELCWLFHLVEDIHQPLHAITLFDLNHRTAIGDRGGNETYISINAGPKLKLHWYWDDLVQGTMATIPDHAQQLLVNSIYSEAGLPEQNDPKPENWMRNESFNLAKTVAYKNGLVNGTKAHPTIVDNTYDGDAKKLAEKRVVLAGIRLGKMLSRLFV
jgi:hypothetical protein